MNGDARPSLRPLLLVILIGAVTTALVTSFRSGFVQFRINWPDDQPAAPLLMAGVLVAMLLLVLYLVLSGRRSGARPSDGPTHSGNPRAPTKPSRIGLVAERPPTRFSDVAGAAEA